MTRIGFIDYFIDEWHANHYPQWVRESRLGKSFSLHLAWEERPNPDGRDLHEWCRMSGMTPAVSIEKVVDESDAIVVLAPNNPETHRHLADLPLRSGKPVYIDKTFAPDLETAKELFTLADTHGTPLFSSSALRFTKELQEAVASLPEGGRFDYVRTTGEKNFESYLVHQLEIIVAATNGGVEAVRFLEAPSAEVMQAYDASAIGAARVQTLQLRFRDGRLADLAVIPEHPFLASLIRSDGAVTTFFAKDFFPAFIDAMLNFFLTGVSPVPKEQTMEIMALIDAANVARTQPDSWREVPS